MLGKINIFKPGSVHKAVKKKIHEAGGDPKQHIAKMMGGGKKQAQKGITTPASAEIKLKREKSTLNIYLIGGLLAAGALIIFINSRGNK